MMRRLWCDLFHGRHHWCVMTVDRVIDCRCTKCGNRWIVEIL
jgi:hypothetical protein